MTKPAMSISLFVILLTTTMFFYGTIGNGYYLILFSFIPVVAKLLNKVSLETTFALEWFFFLLAGVVSTLLTRSRGGSLRFMYLMIAYFLIRILLDNEYNWQSLFVKLTYFFSFLCVAATLLSYVLPDVMLKIAELLFEGDILTVYKSLFSRGAYAGITGQTSLNGFFISIFIAFVVGQLINGNKKYTTYIMLAFGVIALLMTQKRSFLVANIFSVLVLFWRNAISDSKRSKRIFRFIVLGAVIFLVFRYSPAAREIMEKFHVLDDAGDTSNGRYELWQLTFDIWKQNPVLGAGAGALANSYGIATHNSYIQVLAEMGIAGFISFISLLLVTLSKSFKKYEFLLNSKYISEKDKKNCGISIYIQVLFIVYSFFGNPLHGISFMMPYVMFTSLIESYYNRVQYNLVRKG